MWALFTPHLYYDMISKNVNLYSGKFIYLNKYIWSWIPAQFLKIWLALYI